MRTTRLALVLGLAVSLPCGPLEAANLPTLDDFRVDNIPVDGDDAPVISNNWLWARAGIDGANGVLNMIDVRGGVEPSFSGTVTVTVNGRVARPDPRVATWWPNRLTRRVTEDLVEVAGTVLAARDRYALLNRLVVTNLDYEPKTVDVELAIAKNGGHHGTVESPSSLSEDEDTLTLRFDGIRLLSGQWYVVRIVNLYRSSEAELRTLLDNFEAEVGASHDYWNALLEDAYTPGPGPYFEGHVPRLDTREPSVQRFYDFGVMTLLMAMRRDLDTGSGPHAYVTALAQSEYGPTTYLWDSVYVSELLATLDPPALRAILERWAYHGVNRNLTIPYDRWDEIDMATESGEPRGFGAGMFAPGRFYAANSSSFFLSAWNYLSYTGDYEWLEKTVRDRTMLEWIRDAVEWRTTRPQWNGLAHYGQEENTYDDDAVPGYEHWVAAPNAGDVWISRRLADLYETLYDDAATAGALREDADRIARALIEHLYDTEGEYAGSWKVRHEDGGFQRMRHVWDFGMAGSFLTEDLSPEQRQQMRDWFMGCCVRVGSDDVWIVAQDPRDLNNGPHQREHNGTGAFPTWPYHAGWALHAMGYHHDVIDVLRVIDGITAWGPIGQGHFTHGRRARSNWVNLGGASAAVYLIHNVFDVWPGMGEFAPSPRFGDFDPAASLENVLVKGRLYRVTAEGAQEAIADVSPRIRPSLVCSSEAPAVRP